MSAHPSFKNGQSPDDGVVPFPFVHHTSNVLTC